MNRMLNKKILTIHLSIFFSLCGCSSTPKIQHVDDPIKAELLTDIDVCNRTSKGLGTNAENNVAKERNLDCAILPGDTEKHFAEMYPNFNKPETKNTKSNISQNKTQAIPVKVKYEDRITFCETLTKDSLNFPSTYDSSIFSKGITPKGSTSTVLIDFEAKNAFGLTLPYQSICLFENNSFSGIQVTPR